MPELSEVELFRRRWNCGRNHRVEAVHLHGSTRVFRGTNAAALKQAIPGAVLKASMRHGKQMLFRFSGDLWIGIHLGMTGELRVASPDFTPGRHDHLILVQRKRSLVFRDARQFGRVRFHPGQNLPAWWPDLPPDVLSARFTMDWMERFLRRHRKAPLKAVLLLQSGFPGIGNWMADEILWRARLHPGARAAQLAASNVRRLWRALRWVCENAMRIVAEEESDPPPSWLFPHRWEAGGHCPRCRAALDRATVGGRTTCWCPDCQHQRCD